MVSFCSSVNTGHYSTCAPRRPPPEMSANQTVGGTGIPLASVHNLPGIEKPTKVPAVLPMVDVQK